MLRIRYKYYKEHKFNGMFWIFITKKIKKQIKRIENEDNNYILS
jgi:hypothetical protein